MSRRRSPAFAGTLLLTALLATGCPGNTTTPPTPTPTAKPAATKAPASAEPSPLATIGGGGTSPAPASASPSAAVASPATSPAASPTTSAAPQASPSGAASPGPSGTAAWRYYAADLPLTNNTGAGGAAVGVLAEDEKSFRVGVWTAGATGALTGAHLHQGAVGVTGGVVKGLAIDDTTKRSATGTWQVGDATDPMTPAHLAALKKGEIYAAVHTDANPDGESRGNLVAFLWAGAADMKPVPGATNASAAMGVAWLTMTADKTAKLQVYTAGLTGDITGAHVHQGGPGETGGVVKTLTIGADKKTASGTWTFGASGSEVLTDALIAELKVGKLYVAVHTAQNKDGEIRGQLLAP